MIIRFEWDPNKDLGNLRKHGVAFKEAATVFADYLSTTVPDPDHSAEEDPFITVGSSHRNRLLMIAHAERGDSIRIISAWELTLRERRQYEEAGMNDELRAEYDLSELLQEGERGKYADRYRQGSNLMLLAPDVAEVFTDEESVNEALRLVMQLAQIPRRYRHSVAEK